MNNSAKLLAVLAFSLVAVSVASAQTSVSPQITLSSNEASFFNGDQGSIDVTVKNKDEAPHTFTVSVFPGTLDMVSAFPSISHLTLQPGESGSFKVSFSSQFEAEFVPRSFSITIASTDDRDISSTKQVFVHILRRSPVFVLGLNTNKFTYEPGETLNVSYVVANNGGDSTDSFTVQTVIAREGEFLKRFEREITFLPERSRNTFSNQYSFEQFSEPGTYSIDLTLLDASGQTLSKKSVNFNVAEVSKASQKESSTIGIFESTTRITSTNEGNAPSDIKVTAIIPSFAKELFDSDIKPASMEDVGASVKATWVFEKVPAGQSVEVIYKLGVWKIWASIMAVIFVIWLAFKFVFTVRIGKMTNFHGNVKKDAEIPVSIEIVNRSMSEIKDIMVRDPIPGIAEVVPKFETVKPTIHKTQNGSEIVWKFDSLRPGEERVVAYRIKSKMDILGSLRLNPATIYYSTRSRKKKSAASNLLMISKQ